MMLKLVFATLISVAISASGWKVLPEKVKDLKWNDALAVDVRADSPSYKEVPDKICEKPGKYWKNSPDGMKAMCDKSDDCLGYYVRKNTARGCLKKDNTGGLKEPSTGIKDASGYKLFIKENCADGIKNQDETDIDCGGAKCDACKLKNSCAPQPTCDGNLPAPDCVSGVCKCGSADTCLAAKKDTAPVCVSGTCKCASAVDECTGDKKCIGGACVDACGDSVACPTTEVCDSGICKCQDKDSVKGPTCVGHPGGEICDNTVSGPTCKCTATVASCAGNPLKPNCNAGAGKCECASGDDGCTAPHKCVGKECKCGTAAACTDPLAPTCDASNSKCMCGTGPGCDNFNTADTCDTGANKCKCGAADPCTKPQVCKNAACADP